jgi:hypothetical protein
VFLLPCSLTSIIYIEQHTAFYAKRQREKGATLIRNMKKKTTNHTNGIPDYSAHRALRHECDRVWRSVRLAHASPTTAPAWALTQECDRVWRSTLLAHPKTAGRIYPGCAPVKKAGRIYPGYAPGIKNSILFVPFVRFVVKFRIEVVGFRKSEARRQ